MQTKKEKRKGAQVSVTGTLPKEAIEKAHAKTLARIVREVELPGFRKGKAPEAKVREYVGEKALWKEAAESALREELETILKEQEVAPIMPVSITTYEVVIAEDMRFEIIAVVAPTCSIDNYKHTAQEALKKVPTFFDEVGTPTPLGVGEKEQAVAALKAQTKQMTQSDSDTLTDDQAKKLGFENATALEFFLGEEADRAVKERDVQRKRSAIAEALIEKAQCDMPHALVHQEASQLLEATKRDVAAQGMPFNEYLKHRGKTEDELHGELEGPAEKRVALDIIFGQIARAEKIAPDKKDEERLAHALVQQGVEQIAASRYVRATVMREKVWELLGAKAESKV